LAPDLAYGFLTAVAKSGGTVFLHDIRSEALAAGVGRIEKYMDKAKSRGKLSAKDAETMRTRLVATTDLKALSSCDYVLEAATENLKIKTGDSRRRRERGGDDCLLGFATSGISETADRCSGQTARAMFRQSSVLSSLAGVTRRGRVVR